jgi:hypothetical protein
MALSGTRSGRGFGPEQGPLDAVAAAFGWLLEGPDPLAVDGGDFAGLPDRAVPLGELRERLLDPGCRPATRDAVWAHLVGRSRREGGAWTIGCVGVGLPALLRIAATLTARFAGDPRDVHAATLTGFLTALAEVEVDRPRIMLRLRWAAYRAGHAALREALDAPTPIGDDHPGTPVLTSRAGHPDLVLARAVADGVLTADEAELIAATRWDGESLAAAARRRRAGYEATKKARRRAELRLAAYLQELAADPDIPSSRPTGSGSTAATTRTDRSRSVTAKTGTRRRRVSPDAAAPGVQERQNRSATSPTAPPNRPSGASADTAARTGPGPDTPPEATAEESRCA